KTSQCPSVTCGDRAAYRSTATVLTRLLSTKDPTAALGQSRANAAQRRWNARQPSTARFGPETLDAIGREVLLDRAPSLLSAAAFAGITRLRHAHGFCVSLVF